MLSELKDEVLGVFVDAAHLVGLSTNFNKAYNVIVLRELL